MMSASFPHSSKELARLHDCGRYSAVEKCCQDNLRYSLSLHGENHPDSYLAVLHLSQSYYHMFDYAASELNVRLAIELAQRIFGEKSHQVAGCLSNLGRLQFRMGRDVEAEETLDQATELIPQLSEGRDAVEAAVLINRAKLLLGRGDLASPESLLLRALRIICREYGRGHSKQGMTLDHLSELYQHRGNLLAAERTIRKAIAIYREASYDESADNACANVRLGRILCDTSRLCEAHSCVLNALEILRRVRPAGHPNVTRAERAVAEIEVKLRTLSNN